MPQPCARPAALLAALLALGAPIAGPAAAASFGTLSGNAPLVIAHRGASGYLPEHTLAAYELAIRMGADIIEPDLQMTSDGHLVAFHDNTLHNDTNPPTNAADVFAPRNGGWLVSDFTLAEIQSLEVKPRLTAQTEFPGFTPSAENPLRVPTFREVLTFLTDYNTANGTDIGIYPESKTPNRPELSRKLVEELREFGFTSAAQPVYIQTFSFEGLLDLGAIQAELGTDMRQVALGGAIVSGGVFGIFEFGTNSFFDLATISERADGLGVFIGNFAAQALSAEWIAAAHDAGLEVHGWTFRPTTLEASIDLTQPFIDWGMDGFFTDFPDLTRQTIALNQPQVIPLPASGLLLLGGLGGLAFLRRRRAAAH
ncbi:glycerophosphodiester phosphodiesterase family protein [Rhodobaculum claviforme]|nr:glycerophosphodiester phosphodiesterase family protein [Rhodobaculum claviforme]